MTKRILIGAIAGALAVSSAQAGVFSIGRAIVRHVAKDAFHVAKYQVVGAVHAVKHAAGDVKIVAK